jgi:hypothetical protein
MGEMLRNIVTNDAARSTQFGEFFAFLPSGCNGSPVPPFVLAGLARSPGIFCPCAAQKRQRAIKPPTS